MGIIPESLTKEPAYALLEKYNTPAKFDTALAALKNYWTHLLSSYIIDTEDKKLCRMVNIWNQISVHGGI
ncbi:MAG: hypothetical protein ACLR7D_02950 [Lachnospira eligens]